MRFGGMVLATVLALSACTSDPAPRKPSPGASSASASPTRAVPTMPPQASEDSAEGAAAFVHHYVDVFNYAAATGDVDELTRLSSPDCDGCQRYIELYRDTYAAGGYFKGGDWKLGELKVSAGKPETVLFAKITSPAGRFRESSDSTPTVGNAEDTDLTFVLEHSEKRWLLTTLELQAK